MVSMRKRQPFENNEKDLTRIVNTYLRVSKALANDLRRVNMNRDNFREKVEEVVLKHTNKRDKSMWLKALKYDTNARFIVRLIKEKVTGDKKKPFAEFAEEPKRVRLKVARKVKYKVRGKVRTRQKSIKYTKMQERFFRTQVRLGKTAKQIQIVFNTRSPDIARNFGAIRSKVYRVRKTL